jgi:hypothetical protein
MLRREFDRIAMVHLDGTPLQEGVPANLFAVTPHVRISPLLRYAEVSSLRARFRHVPLSHLGGDPGLMVLGLFGGPASWLGDDGSEPVVDALPDLRNILDAHYRLMLLLDCSWISEIPGTFWNQMDRFVAQLGLDPTRIVVLVADSLIESGFARHRQAPDRRTGGDYTVIGMDLFLLYSGADLTRRRWPGMANSAIGEAETERLRVTLRPRKFLAVARQPSWHVFMLALMLRDLDMVRDGIVAMPAAVPPGDAEAYTELLDRAGQKMDPALWERLRAGREATRASLPWSDDNLSARTQSPFAFETEDRQNALDSYLRIVTTSDFYGAAGVVRIGERICAAIGALQPFIVFGAAHTYAALRAHGFEPPLHLDLRFDEQDVPGAQLDLLHAALRQIADWSLPDVHAIYHANSDISAHNRDRLFAMPSVLGDGIANRLSELLG